MLIFTPGNAQWIGTRPEQQDAFGFAGCAVQGATRPGGVLVVLADGMGGLQEGRAASQIAVKTMLATYAEQPATTPVPEALECALRAANQAVHELAQATAGVGQVGTTLIAAAVRDGQLFWIGVGDSRLYRYRAADHSLTPCNDEHTLANTLWTQVAAGVLQADDIASHPDRDALTSFLGLPEILQVDASYRPLRLTAGDRLLLCSDGVDGVLSREELTGALSGAPQIAAETLIAALRTRAFAHQDNATVALLACDASDDRPTMRTRRIARPQSLGRRFAVGLVVLLLAGGGVGFGLSWWQGRADAPPPPIAIPLLPPAVDMPAPDVPEAPVDATEHPPPTEPEVT